MAKCATGKGYFHFRVKLKGLKIIFLFIQEIENHRTRLFFLDISSKKCVDPNILAFKVYLKKNLQKKRHN